MATKIWTGASSTAWGTAGNWVGGVPETGDDVYFVNNAVSVESGLDQSAVTLASLTIEQSYTGSIGTASAYLQIGATAVRIGQHFGSGSPAGSGRIKLDLADDCTSLEVYNSATTATDTFLAPIQIKSGANTITTAYVKRGRVGIAVGSPSEAAVITTLVMGYDTSVTGDAIVELGGGVTVTTVSKTGGTLSSRCAATTINNEGGDLILSTAGNLTTLGVKAGIVTLTNCGAIGTYAITGGTCYLDRHDTITTATLTGGVSDWTRSRHARTVTTPTIHAGATARYDTAVVTFTNKLAASGRVSIQAQPA